MRTLIQFVVCATCAVCCTAMCTDAICGHRCMDGYDTDLEYCEPNCGKGTGKCLPGKAGEPVDPLEAYYSYPGCLTPASKGDGKDDGKTADAKGDGKTADAAAAPPACSTTPGLAPGSGTTSYSSTYSVGDASGAAFATEEATIVGVIPDATTEHPGPFPLFMWFPGTSVCPADPIPQYMAQQMAKRGFFAVSVAYPGKMTYEKFTQKTEAVVGSNQHTALSKLCAHEKVNCSLGVAVGGWSQGTHIAALAGKISDKVKAAYMVAGGRPTASAEYWTVCDDANIGGQFSKTKRRYITGEMDEYFSWLTDGSRGVCRSFENTTSNMKLASGYDCGSTADCLQTDGSGYYVTTTDDTCGEVPSHTNWMDTSGPGKELPKAVAVWYKPMNDASLDWLAHAATGLAKYGSTGKNAWTAIDKATCPKPVPKGETKDPKGETKDSKDAAGTTNSAFRSSYSSLMVLATAAVIWRGAA